MFFCAQSEGVSGSEWKTDPASSSRSSRKGLKDNNNRQLAIVNKFCIPFGTEIKLSIYGELDSDCTEVTLHRVANFRVKHFNSDIVQTRRGTILLVILFILPVLILLNRFSVKKHSKQTGFWDQNSDILIPPQIETFQISISFETEKNAKLVSNIVTVLV